MSRRYAAPVEAITPPGSSAPLRFTWAGRRYVVAEVLGHWVGSSPWWRRPAADCGDDAEVWRVEAFPASVPMAARRLRSGIYDLSRRGTDWSLHRIAD